jgi:hypothetical protein
LLRKAKPSVAGRIKSAAHCQSADNTHGAGGDVLTGPLKSDNTKRQKKGARHRHSKHDRAYPP